jgi:2-dehydropantoate 2-reductase
MQNGIPFWYFHKHGGPLEGRPVTSVDPKGVITKNIPCERVIGCVVYPATEQVGPGEIKQIEGNRFPVGDLDGSESERVKGEACNRRFCRTSAPRCGSSSGAT